MESSMKFAGCAFWIGCDILLYNLNPYPIFMILFTAATILAIGIIITGDD